MPNNLTYTAYNYRAFAMGTFLALCCLIAPISATSQENKRESLLAKIAKLEKSSHTFATDTTYINLLIKLGKEYRFIKADSLLKLSVKAASLSESVGYIEGMSSAFNNVGDYYSDKGNSENAISYYKRTLKLADSIQHTKLKLQVMNDLASEYAYSGDYGRALKGYLEGIALAATTENDHMLSILNENLANLYASQKEYTQALEFYEKVKKINQRIGDEVISAETMSNMASLYTDTGNYDYAMFHVNQAISTFEKFGVLDWLAFAYSVKGEVYLGQGKYRWALYWFDQSEIVHNDLEDERGKIDLLNGTAKAHLGLQKDSIAGRYAMEGFEISMRIKSLQGQIDCSETLYEVNRNLKDYQGALVYHEIFHRLSDSLSRDENKRSLTLLKSKLNYDRQQQLLMAENDKVRARQRTIVIVSVLILAILLGTLIPLYLNQKKQKKLYRQLKVKTKILRERESELNGINKTKDKLFSIIGHDLRGPIGALQGLLKLFATGEIAKEDFFGFIPKLRGDVDHISFTLNNLLTWGQAQLKGTVTRPKVVSAQKLVANNINLLAEMAANKSIKILNQLPENPMVLVDEDQIDIVIRNLISNSIKFTPNNGLITIEAEEGPAVWKFMVRDTGIGMNEETQRKIFSDSSNVTTYGTNNEKGTGLGLSLCKEMVVKNKGEIWVESIPKKGSTFYFTLPKITKKYRKAG